VGNETAQTVYFTCGVTMGRVRVTSVAEERQCVLHTACVCVCVCVCVIALINQHAVHTPRTFTY